MLINIGTQERILTEATAGAGITSREGSIRSDSLLATLWVNSVTSGTLDVSVYTLTDTGKEILLCTFPTQSAPSVNLMLRTPSMASMQRFRIQAVYTGVCDYEIYVRAVTGSTSSGAASHVIVDNTPLDVNVTNTVNVNVVPLTGSVVASRFDEALAVASGATQTILTYTVPPTKVAYLLRAEMSGTTIGTYNVLINGVEFARSRTYWSGDFVGHIEIGTSPEDAYKVVAGDVVEIQVTNIRPVSNDYEARLQYIEA